MKKSTPLAEITKLIYSGPDEDDLRQMLDLIPGAVFWIDCRHNRILGGNRNSLLLTAYTLDELKSCAIQTLLPDFAAPATTDAREVNLGSLRLVQRSGTPITVIGSYRLINPKKSWGILSTREDSRAQLDKTDFLDSRISILQDLFIAAQNPQPQQAINDLLANGKALIDCESLTLAYPAMSGKGYILQTEDGNSTTIAKSTDVQAASWSPKTKQFSIEQSRKELPFELDHPSGSDMTAVQLNVANKVHYLLALSNSNNTDNSKYVHLVSEFFSLALSQKSDENLSESGKLNGRVMESNTTIQEGVNDGIVIIDESLKVVDINRAALAALGYAKEDVLDSEIKAMLISPEALMPKIKSAFNKKSPLELGEVNIHRRDGSHYLAHLRIRLFPVSSGKQQAAIFITDLTTKEEYRQQARQLEQRALLGEVTAVFAHEVRNPVNNISTTLQLMKSRLQGDEKSTEQIDRMLDNCQRLDQIMSSTLTFSRSTEFKMQTLAPKEMLESLLVRFQHKLTSESIKLAAAIPNDLPKIKGDAQALDQVFTNIITNAIQAMSDKEKKYLGVKAYKETVKSEEFLRIDITDSGPGIPEEKRQAIFQPFYTSKANGTGLGLTITQRIVNAHSGQIDVKSFEGGTIFYVRLPAIEE